MGVRIQHPQAMINRAMYGDPCPWELPPAPYKLTRRLEGGRGVYSFCMCPGGYVVNASSEQGRLAVNGMSYSGRGGENANSAIVVTVSPEDYGASDVLEGIEFQRKLEGAAFRAGNGAVPLQRFEDYRLSRPSESYGSIRPMIKGQWKMGNVRAILPESIASAVEEGILAFEKQIPGFSDPDALLCGPESRTSSPVRILRNEGGQAEKYPGIFPCGEGAGYAGGITSAAVDGIRVAEQVAAQFLH